MKTHKAQEFLAQTFELLAAGKLREAQRACRKAIQARPDLAEAHLMMSEIHHQEGEAPKARECASRALKLRPGWSEAYVALGNADALEGNLPSAEAHYRSGIAAGSPGPGAHANLGHVLRRQGRLADARDAYEAALACEPGALHLELNLADALSALGRHEDAIASYGRVLETDPWSVDAAFNRARSLFALARHKEAAAALRELLARDPDLSEAREHLLRVLHADAQFAEMERVAREGIARRPEALVFAHQLGVALWWQGRHDESVRAFEAADRPDADPSSAPYLAAKLDQAITLLALGRLRKGWEAYRYRAPRIAWRAKFPRLIEDPRAIAALARPARILVIGEQGLGDDIFFLRFAALLRQGGHELVGCFDKRLLPLLGAAPGLFELTAEYDVMLDADFTVLSGDLPLASGHDAAPPLALSADPARQKRFEALLRESGPPPYIGVTWRAGALPDERNRPAFYLTKHVPPSELGAALRSAPGTICSLQRRPDPEEQGALVLALGRGVLDLSAVNDDLEDALALLSVLDDYVGVSNTNMHLRAACSARRARVLLSSNPEWRWGLRGSRSLWFPDFLLYRETPGEGWRPALEEMRAALAA